MIHDNSTTVVHCVLDSYGSVPNIEEESYDTKNSSASISFSSLHQHQRPRCAPAGQPTGWGCRRPCEAAAAAPAVPAASRPVGFKRPVGFWIKAKTIFFQKNRQTFKHLIVPDQIYYCVYQISTVWLGPIHCKYIQSKCSQATVNCIFAGHVSEQTDLAN